MGSLIGSLKIGTDWKPFVETMKNLSPQMQAVAINASAMSTAQKQAMASALGLSMAEDGVTVSSTSAVAAENAATASINLNTMSRVGNTAATTAQISEEVKSLLVKGGLITEDQIQAKTTVTVTAAKIADAVATGLLTSAEGTLLLTSLGLTGATAGLGAAFKGLTASMLTNPLFWALGAGLAIWGIIKAVDFFTESVEEAKEAANESAQEYETLTSELESLNNELSITQDRIDELNSKEHLTFVEQDEIQKLKDSNDELERSIELKQTLAEVAKAEAREEALNYLNKTDSYYRDYVGFDMSQVGVGNARQGQVVTDIASGNQIDLANQRIDDYKMLIERQKELQVEIDNFITKNPQKYENQDAYINMDLEMNAIDNSLKILRKDLPTTIEELDRFVAALDPLKDSQYVDSINMIIDTFNDLFGKSNPTQSFEEVWNAEWFEKDKKALIELAQAGTLKPETLSSMDSYKKLLEATGKSAKEVTENIYALTEAQSGENKHIFTKSDMISEINNLSEGFEKLDKIYADVKDKGTFDFGNLADDKFVEIFSKDKEAYEDFIETVSSSPTDINACQSAFDKLVGSWLGSTRILENVTADTKDVTVAMLENMGISNAEAIVTELLTAKLEAQALEKEFLAEKGYELADASIAEINEFINSANASDLAKQHLAQLALAKINVNDNKIDTESDIDQVINLANAAGASAAKLAALANVKAILGSDIGDPFSKNYDPSRVRSAQETLDKLEAGTFDFDYQPIDANQFKKAIYSGGGTSNKDPKGSKKSGKEFSEQIDYIDRLLEVSERKLKEYKNELEDATTIDGKYTAIDKIVKETEYQLKQLQEVYDFYAEKASQTLAQIPEAMREQVKNGTVNIETLNDEKLSKLIKEFYDLDGSVEDTKDKMRDLNKEIDDVKKQKIQIQIEYQERRKDKLERIQQRYEAAISAVTSSVQDEIDAVNKYYDNQIKKIQDQIDALDEENDRLELQRKLEKALYDLRRAENQRTARIYREGKGFVYEADQNAIRDAQQNYDDAMFEKTKFDLQQIIDRLEKERDQEVDYLTEIKDAWSDIADSFQRMADAKVADNLFGTGWLDDILNGDTSLFDEMTDKFGSVFDGIFNADQAIQSFNDLLDSINNGEITTDGAVAAMTESLSTLGATTTEQTGIMGSGYTSVATSAETARNLSVETYGMWTENLLIFQEQTLEICNSIIAQFNAMADSVVAAAERAKKAAEDIKEAAESSSGSRDYTSSSSGPGGRSDPGYVDSGPGVHHKGVLAGRVGGNQSSKDNQLATLQEASIRPLKPDERYIRALEGELVFTKEQQSTLFNNINLLGIDTSKLSLPTIDYSKIRPVKPESQTVEYNFSGGIHITEAQNVMDIAKGIKNGTLRMALNQELYKR